MEKTAKTETAIELILAVKKVYFHNYISKLQKKDHPTTIGESLKLKMVKNENGSYIIADCYNEFDIRFDPLDDLYRKACNDRTDIDEFLRIILATLKFVA